MQPEIRPDVALIGRVKNGGDKDTLRTGGDGVKTQQTANMDCGENADLFTVL